MTTLRPCLHFFCSRSQPSTSLAAWDARRKPNPQPTRTLECFAWVKVDSRPMDGQQERDFGRSAAVLIVLVAATADFDLTPKSSVQTNDWMTHVFAPSVG